MFILTIILTIFAWNRNWRWTSLWPAGVAIFWGFLAVIEPVFAVWNLLVNLALNIVLVAMIVTNGRVQKMVSFLKVSTIVVFVGAVFIAAYEKEIESFLSYTSANTPDGGVDEKMKVHFPSVKVSDFRFQRFNDSVWAIVSVYNEGRIHYQFIDMEITNQTTMESRRFRMRTFLSAGNSIVLSPSGVGPFSSADFAANLGSFYSANARFTIRLAPHEDPE